MNQIDMQSDRFPRLQEAEESYLGTRRGISYESRGLDTKSLHRVSRDLGDNDSLQTNWGRVQQSGRHQYTVFFVALSDAKQKTRVQPTPRPEPTSEQFDGFVERVEGNVAYITLKSSRGEELCGPYPADELAAHGVGERDRFRLILTDMKNSIRFDIQLIPRKVVSAERQAEIQREIEKALGGYTGEDDY